MAAGKSTIGPRLAAVLSRPFADCDSVIERHAGCTVSEIFSRDGEAAFRKLEAAVLKRLLDGIPAVIATGGGAFLQPANRIRIRRQALSVWLRTDLDVMVQRIRQPGARPLLAGASLRDTLLRLMQERYPTYATADAVVESENVDPDETSRHVLTAIAATRA